MFPPQTVKEQDELLIAHDNTTKYRIFHNRLVLTSLLNLAFILVFIFSMGFYRWAQIALPISGTQTINSQIYSEHTILVWISMVYVKQTSLPYYQSFSQIQDQYCALNDIYCQAVLNQLAFVGYLSFGILMCAILYQVIDGIRTILFLYRIWFKQASIQEEFQKKDNIRHYVAISTFLVGITLNVFGYIVIDLASLAFGLSFWLLLACLLVFIIVLIYQRISIKDMEKQQMMMSLIQNEKIAREKLEQKIEMSSEGDFYF